MKFDHLLCSVIILLRTIVTIIETVDIVINQMSIQTCFSQKCFD